MIIEACVETLEEAIIAEQNGADQIELCSDLEHDGLTPSIELITEVLSKIQIPIKAMIRPRSGNFIYSTEEVDKMISSIKELNHTDIAGYVLGATTPSSKLDIAIINKCCEHVSNKTITVHKAIDTCSNILDEVKRLKEECSKVSFILSSGGEQTANEGKEVLRNMASISGSRIQIIPAGSVTKANLNALHQFLNLNYYHGRRIV